MMGASEDLIDFELIENQKENIQSLPSGRSAKALAQLFSPRAGTGPAPSPSETQNFNDTIRHEYEKELITINESDDPLDIYDRYVKWALDAYPSVQATQSQILPLLERATKAFLSSAPYKNDLRYLRIWLHYIRLFSDAPKETYAFLARHGIGDQLALFYEEFAAWLESSGRWTQAEEVYQLGLEREARPVERLMRKYTEFKARFESRPTDAQEPSSPALPTVRPALAAKIDPFSLYSSPTVEPQAQSRTATAPSKSGRQKMSIFSDADEPPRTGSSDSSKGWDKIGSIAERKKENTMTAKPWAGEKLKTTKTNSGVPKMMIFKDETATSSLQETNSLRKMRNTVNPKSGRTERVFVDLEAVYPSGDPKVAELCFEELRAKHRGWLNIDWAARRQQESDRKKTVKTKEEQEMTVQLEAMRLDNEKPAKLAVHRDTEDVENIPPQTVPLKDADRAAAKKARKEERANRTRKIMIMEVQNEAQKVTTNFESPTGPKIKRKKSGSTEPTMTFHTREAMDEIYGIFNQPLNSSQESGAASDDGSSDDDDDDYTSGAESATGRISASASEFGDTTSGDFTTHTAAGSDSESDGEETTGTTTDVKSVSDWSDFTASKHVPKGMHDDDREDGSEVAERHDQPDLIDVYNDDLATPTSPRTGPQHFVPSPPDMPVPTHPYRDPSHVAQSRLPFMTPIVEKTESTFGAATAFAKAQQEKDYFAKAPYAKTPTKLAQPQQRDLWSSPFQDVTEEVEEPLKVPQPLLKKSDSMPRAPLAAKKEVASKAVPPKGPIIKDPQCNPVEDQVKDSILAQVYPPLTTYEGYFDRTAMTHGRSAEIRKFTKAMSKVGRNANEKTATNLSMPPLISLEGSDREYTIKRELGKGAFAPVYLAESMTRDDDAENVSNESVARMGKGAFGIQRNSLEAIKMEEPPSAWEFYMIRQTHRRLGVSRAVESIVHAYEMHVFRDECYLIEEYRGQGTILDLVNIAKEDAGSGGVMDEQLAMFFSIELLRTAEALHSKGILHGDIKSDNVLVRLDNSTSKAQSISEEKSWASEYSPSGAKGWSSKGITLIDFGRGIDMKVFTPDVQFIADWKTSEADCAEMRELRPWTYQVDYHGIAGLVHNLLFGKYIETIAERSGTVLGAGQTKSYRIRESLKRYWQTEIWAETFALLLNPMAHLEQEEGRKMPVLKGMRSVREKMEAWLAANCEKGVGLRGQLRKLEAMIRERRR